MYLFSHVMCGFCLFCLFFCVYLCVLVHMYVVSTCMCGGQEDILNIICEVSSIHPSFFLRQKSHWTEFTD